MCHALRHGVADELLSEHILHASQIQPAFIRTHIGDVCQPDLARCVGTEVLGQQIGRHRQGVCRVRGRAKAAFLPAVQAHLAPQTSDTIPSDLLSLVPQQRMYAPHPIGLAPRLVSRPDVNTQALVVPGPLAGPALEPGQIAAARDFQCPTGHGQRVPLAVNPVLQEHVPCKDSFAKYAAAFFTISRSISARASSRRSRTTSA